MILYSTNGQAPEVSLKEAVLRGLAPDGGLYMPKEIPKLPQEFFDNIHTLTFQEIALEVAHTLIGDDIPKSTLKRIVDEAINFDAPLVRLKSSEKRAHGASAQQGEESGSASSETQRAYVLELFHGPTLAFKDFGARFMARLVSYLSTEPTIVLVATSGDTGSAVAQGFYNVPDTEVILLYPSGKVSHIQEQQLTTLKGNITALEIEGTFDDCQRLVKKAFNERTLDHLNLTSANSINIARLIPQSFYYFWAYAQQRKYEEENTVRAHGAKGRRVMSRGPLWGATAQQGEESGSASSEPTRAYKTNQNIAPVFSIPSGNFGNLTAGLFAKRMGLPVSKFIAATNSNDTFPNYLESGNFEPKASKQTISNAMDVGNPSNFARITALYKDDLMRIRKDIYSHSFTDSQTKEAIQEVHKKYDYTMDPHGAVAYLGLQKYLEQRAHSAKGRMVMSRGPIWGATAQQDEQSGSASCEAPRAYKRSHAPTIFFETAHPAKFKDTVEEVLQTEVETPPRLAKCLDKKKHSTKLSPEFHEFKRWLRGFSEHSKILEDLY